MEAFDGVIRHCLSQKRDSREFNDWADCGVTLAITDVRMALLRSRVLEPEAFVVSAKEMSRSSGQHIEWHALLKRGVKEGP